MVVLSQLFGVDVTTDNDVIDTCAKLFILNRNVRHRRDNIQSVFMAWIYSLFEARKESK